MSGGSKAIAWLMAILVAAMLSACSTTRVDRGHTLIQQDLSESYANVYFIRPNTEHPQGFPDNPLIVEVNGERLMQLGKGDRILTRLKARDVTITMRNQTQVRGRWEVTEMAQTRKFNLEPSRTYYIQAKNVDGEFRGVTFVPESISQFEAEPLIAKASMSKETYVSVQYGNLKSKDNTMGSLGVVAGYPINRLFSVEGQATFTLDKEDQVGGGTLSASSLGLFAVLKSPGKIYGKARLGLARVELDEKVLGVTFSEDTGGFAYGIGVGANLGKGAVEVEYTKLPTLDTFLGVPVNGRNSYISVGYVNRFNGLTKDAYISAQYGNLKSEDATMGNIGLVAGYPVNRLLSVEGQATFTLNKEDLGDGDKMSASSLGLFAALKSPGNIYGKARLGLAQVGFDMDVLGVALSDSASGVAFGAGLGASVDRGAIEIEYTKLPTLDTFAGFPMDARNSYLSVGYLYKF